MAAELFYVPQPVAFTTNGLPSGGAKAYFYEEGTLTPAPVYTSSALTTAHAHPVVANGAGRLPEIYLNSTLDYRLIIKDRDGNTLGDEDPYSNVVAVAGEVTAQMSNIFGVDLGQIAPGVVGDFVMTRSFSGDPGGASGLYGINHQVNANGVNNVESVRSAYFGTNVLTTAGTTALLESIHAYVWVKGAGNVSVAKAIEAHIVAGVADGGGAGTGTITSDATYFNCAGITLGTITIPKVTGFNVGGITDAAKVTNAYGFNVEHNQAATETMGYRSQVRIASGAYSFVANTNDGSAAAPAVFTGKAKVGSASPGVAVAPLYDFHVLGNAADYAACIQNRAGVNPFGIKIEYTTAAPAGTGNDFINCRDSGATRFQVASNGAVSINGTRVLHSQRTGWGAATGTATRTTYDTATVTTAQLAERLKALLDDLTQHGLIGA